VLSPDGYTILPMRPVTATRTVAIFIVFTVDRILHAVNAHAIGEQGNRVKRSVTKG
jgi:hypothetical protein